MKFTIFALIAGLCLMAVSANGGASMPEIEDDFIDVDNFTILSATYRVFKAALRTLKGVNCSIQGVINMRNAAYQFVADVQACGGEVSKQLQAVIDACNAVISTANDIINFGDNVCNAGNDSDDGSSPPKGCAGPLLKKLVSFNKQLKNVVKLVKKVPSVPGQVGQCVNNALNQLTTTFTSFPSFVKTCSKLTS